MGRETKFYIHMKLQVKLFCANCEGFHSGVFEGSILLGCEAPSLDNRFPTFRNNVAPSSSRVEISFFLVTSASEDENNTLHRKSDYPAMQRIPQ